MIHPSIPIPSLTGLVPELPDRHTRAIEGHNIFLASSDLEIISPHFSNKKRLNSFVVDAVGAIIQREKEPNANFLVFSSGLPARCGTDGNVFRYFNFLHIMFSANFFRRRISQFGNSRATHPAFFIFHSPNYCLSICFFDVLEAGRILESFQGPRPPPRPCPLILTARRVY